MSVLPRSQEQSRSSLSNASWILFVAAAFLALLLYNPPSLGQSTFGSVVGTVKDASGDVIVTASVVLMNSGTAAKRTLSTDASGYFSFVNLEPGAYQLTVEQTGFQKVEFVNLDLQSRETKRIDALLKVATQSQTVLVEETGDALHHVAHLAGALGKPVWLLNRFGSEWRWGLASDRSPWYPSMRQFRQQERSSWADVIARVADELGSFKRVD